LRAPGGIHEASVPQRAETGGRGEHRVPDDTREASDAVVDRRIVVAADGRSRHVLLLPSTAAADHVHRAPQSIAGTTTLPFISVFEFDFFLNIIIIFFF